MGTKLVTLKRDQWDTEGVPESLRQAVRVLDQAIAIDRLAVTKALDIGVPLSEKSAKAFLAHPSIVVGGPSDDKCHLSGLGLLNGILSTEKFRLCVHVDFDGAPYEKFDVVKVVEV